MRTSIKLFIFSCVMWSAHALQDIDWTLRALRIQGVSFGKQSYYPLYEIANGDVFSYERHKESVVALERALKTEGYLVAQVHSYFKYYNDKKVLDVILTIDKNQLFKVSEVFIKVLPSELLTPLQSEQLMVLIKHQFIDALKNKSYTNELVNQKVKAIKLFLEQRGLTSSHVELHESINRQSFEVVLDFSIDLERSRSFEFFGNHYFSAKDLMRIVAHFGKDAGMLPAEILAQEVLSEYHKKGFWNAAVTTTTEGQKDYFVIHEGLRACIKKVMLKGVETYQKEWLEKKFLSTLKTKQYDVDKEKKVLNGLIEWYQEQGFWDARILQRKNTCIKDQSYTLEVVLDEGVQRFIKSVHVRDYPDVMKHHSFAYINYNKYKKIPFSPVILAEQKAYLTKIVRSRGYLHAVIEYALEQKKDGWHVVWTLNYGQQVTFGNTTICGYTKVPLSLLKKQLDYQPGQVWSKEKLQNTVTRFRSLDIFERVHVRPVYTQHKGSARDIVITVQEDDPFEVKVRLGYQQVSKSFAFKKESSYRAGAICLWRNPFKKADLFLLDLSFTRFDRLASGIYKIPVSFFVPCMATIKGYTKKYTQPVSVGSQKTLYETDQDGFSIGLSSHNKHFDAGCTVGLEWAKTKNVSAQLAKAMRFEADLIDKRISYFVIQPTLYLDFLNDKLNPTQGIFASLSLKGMMPFEESSYLIKFFAEEGVFVPMGVCTFAGRVRFGHIFRKSFTAIMPPERFYLGGAHSLRGYQTDKCPPLGSFVDEVGLTQWVPQGGKSMVNINLELRIPLHRRVIQGVVFQDFGALEEDVHVLFEPKKPLAATGFGLRYATPIGPLRFDIGWKWNKQTPEESSYAWFLTFGHAF
ncbi:MAG: outer membrane protein assembly factor BamA [Alteromonas naphthalenivorans]|jgi:outer membrane protein assembly factor BamA